MNLRTLYIFHKRDWRELYSQIKDLEKVGSPYFNRISEDITVTFPIPIEWEPTEEGSITRKRVTWSWIQKNLLPVAPNQDIVVFHIPTEDWQGGDDNAHCYRGYGSPSVICVHSHEGEMPWNNPNFLNKGFYERTQHEFAHAAYDILGIRPDRTHEIEAKGQLWKKEFYQDLRLIPSDAVQATLGAIADLAKKIIDLLLKEINKEKLKLAIIQKESGGNDWAIGDTDLANKAYGSMQIRQPAVDDVNQAKGWNHKAEDMLGNRELSRQYFDAYCDLYATEERLGRSVTDEDRARNWNGGPDGYKRASTLGYWEDIKRILKTL